MHHHRSIPSFHLGQGAFEAHKRAFALLGDLPPSTGTRIKSALARTAASRAHWLILSINWPAENILLLPQLKVMPAEKHVMVIRGYLLSIASWPAYCQLTFPSLLMRITILVAILRIRYLLLVQRLTTRRTERNCKAKSFQVRGHTMTTWTQFCPFLTTTYLNVDIFNPERGQKQRFLDHLPPLLVHVVIECLLIQVR